MDWKTVKNWCEAKRLAIRQWIAARDTDGKIVAILWESAAYAAVAAFVLGLFLGAEKFRDIALAMAAILGFPLLFQRTRTASQQAETDSRRRMAEAYAKAADLFSKAELPLRLAGLYALWKIAEEDPENHHIQIMRILCAFVRNPTPLDGWEEGDGKYPAERPDIAAILNLIARGRTEQQFKCERANEYQIDFQNINLRRANFSSAYLRRSVFNNADLRGASFDKADLQSAHFGYADLRNASFFYADLRNGSFNNSKIGDPDESATRGNLFNILGSWDAAINGADLSKIIPRSLRINKMGVVLIDDAGEILLPGAPLLPSDNTEEIVSSGSLSSFLRSANLGIGLGIVRMSELSRMTLREWEEKRARK